MAQGQASTRELATAYGILQGKSVSAAMRDAGYADTTARTSAGKVEARLRELGLLPKPEDVRDVLAMFRETIMADGGEGLKRAWLSHLSRSQAGDPQAMRFIMEYLAGKPTAPVEVSGPGGGPVETVTRLVVEWPGDRQGDDADGDSAG